MAPAQHDPRRSSGPEPATAPAGVAEQTVGDMPTASHRLAQRAVADSNGEGKGVDRVEHGHVEVRDLGWDARDTHNQRLVDSMDNEELWALVRRFNKQMFHVKSIGEKPLTGLDMNIAAQEDVSPEKLQSHVERLYITVVIALFSFYKHMVRLRSWRERQRTLRFLAVYALAWLADLLAPTLVAFLILLTLSPSARQQCFPPAPPSLIDSETGGIQKPLAGELATGESITGAPEKHRGEAIEQEAHSFLENISKLLLSISSGKYPQQAGAYQDDMELAPDPTEMAQDMTDARDATEGHGSRAGQDKTKEPVSRAVQSFELRPAMHALPDFVDTWERLANALSPTPPFRHRPRRILAASLLPLLLASCATTPYIMVKGLEFAIGFGFFGSPIISRLVASLDHMYPRWRAYTELRNTVLRGVPTNAQLTLTFLRIGEGNKAPLPPPPDMYRASSPQRRVQARDLDHLGASQKDIHNAMEPQPTDEEEKKEEHQGSNMSRRIGDAIKRSAKGGIRAMLKLNAAQAWAGGHGAKDRLGALKVPSRHPAASPVRFAARYKGRKGQAYITTTATSPAISWTSEPEAPELAWTVAIAGIGELVKVGGMGWKSKILVGWALGGEVADGLLLKTEGGQEFYLTAVSLRDEMFNRLIAIGSQMWEAW